MIRVVQGHDFGSNFWLKIEIVWLKIVIVLAKDRNFWRKIEILAKDRTFWGKIKIFGER